MITLIFQSLRKTLLWTVLLGLLYPALVTGLAQLAFPGRANGSLVMRNGQAVGSALLAQPFADARYFWPRPSAGAYATVPSGASNLGPTSAALQSNVAANARAFLATNGLAATTPVPADMAFASASGLDPHISPEARALAAATALLARGVPLEQVGALVGNCVELPQFGFFGEPRVNVLLLNLALDRTCAGF